MSKKNNGRYTGAIVAGVLLALALFGIIKPTLKTEEAAADWNASPMFREIFVRREGGNEI